MENIIASSEATPAQTVNIAATIAHMRRAGRTHLIHYAGAAHRDLVAWHMCREYLAAPDAGERELKSRALKAAWGIDVAPDQIWSEEPVRAAVRKAIESAPSFVATAGGAP